MFQVELIRTVYAQDTLKNKIISDGYVTITKGVDVGHNGKVIWEQQIPILVPFHGSFCLVGCSNIKLEHMTFRNGLDNSIPAYAMINIYGCFNIMINNDTIISNGNGFGIYVQDVSAKYSPLGRSKNISITNNYIEVEYNKLNPLSGSPYAYGQDPIWLGYCDGGFTISGNTIVSHSAYGSQHPDLIQMYDVGSIKNYEFKIANNLMIMDNTASSNAQGIYLENGKSNRFLIYNNIVKMNTTLNVPFPITGTSGDGNVHISIRLFNNTVIVKNSKSPQSSNMSYMTRFFYGVDTVMIENNIFNDEGTAVNPLPLVLGENSYENITYLVSDYNYYDFTNDNSKLNSDHIQTSAKGNSHTWDEWRGLGIDKESLVGSVNFIKPLGIEKTDYTPNNINNSGKNLYLYFNSDILGNKRPNSGTWTIGAIEKQ